MKRELISEPDLELLAAWDVENQSKGANRVAASSQSWPEPAQLVGELPPVQSFRESLLPSSFRPLVCDIADRMQVPLDYPATVIVLCLAGAVNRRALIQPKANDSGWVVVPNLWGGLIAPPGSMKSPVISAAVRPLERIQSGWRHDHINGLKQHATVQEEYELIRSGWKEQFKAYSKKGKTPPPRPVDPPVEPVLRRVIVNDSTFEALHQVMNENPSGIFVIRDELTGWWSQLDRAGREGERAFCLQAWNGDTGHTIDRIGRGTIHVDACCMSMLGGIQPGRLRSYLSDTLVDGASNDGLIQRFQVLVWPDTSPQWEYIDRAPDQKWEHLASQVFQSLVQGDPDDAPRLQFSPEAQELFVHWISELEIQIRREDMHPALIAHLSKYRSLMPALALLFELADKAAGLSHGESVSLEHAQQSVQWCEYLRSHANRIYSCVITPQRKAACDLGAKIKGRSIGSDGSFTLREVYLKGWAGLDSPESVKLAAVTLADANWVREEAGEKGAGGRPANRYTINPRIWE